MSGFAEFLAIRKLYAKVMPNWIEDYKATGRMYHDPYFHEWKFSPIEYSVWCDLRCAGLPFYPQVPVLNYFLDFGCPFKKIGIECDGAQWHDHDRDAERDERLSAEGWEIFRIPGHECKRSITLPENEGMADPREATFGELSRYYMDTSEGLIEAIGAHYFGLYDRESRRRFYANTLLKHQTATGWI